VTSLSESSQGEVGDNREKWGDFWEKSDRGLDLGFWEILKPLKWTNITSFFLIWLKRSTKFFMPL
jgi:hypothetical protein